MNQSNLRTIDSAHLANLSRALVGFDRYFNGHFANTNGNYPPHNIVKYNETHYGIEVAVAGFSREEIAVEVDQDQLTIRGVRNKDNDVTTEYLHRGLATRDFAREFPLAEHIEVTGAEIKNGMLIVNLVRNIPESAKPRVIDIVKVS